MGMDVATLLGVDGGELTADVASFSGYLTPFLLELFHATNINSTKCTFVSSYCGFH
ncbi:hypothetical protein HanIR_Chr11g0509451 [Helianthus annuus]|nr:hypothetical protein HanIR_Chr11g0509451 [Helianthus annuus]